MLYVKLFGTPSIAWLDEPIELARRQARALLYRLAAENAAVPRSQLSFLFWPDVHDRKSRQNLTRLVSYIRGALPDPGLLVASRDDIGLDRARCTSDGRRFRSLLDQGGDAALAEAVGLCDGPFLAGFDLPASPEFESWQFAEQARLERQFLSALIQLIDRRTAAGDHQTAIDYARRYLAADELAEEVHRRLISLFASVGDRAAAQRQYESCVTVLERELGVAPLPETRAVYRQAMAEPQSLAAAQAALPAMQPKWAVLPSLDLPLIGRDHAWRQLAQAFERLANGGVIFVSGEPGVGKSRLLQEFADANQGRLILTGNSHARSRELPYQPIVQALRLSLAQPDLWAGIRAIWLAETTTILPELRERFPDLPPPLQVEPDQAQARLFEALSRVLLHLASQRPLLLCLDDLHWADEATLAFLAYLVSRLPASAICIVATFRTEEAQPLIDLQQTLRRAGLQQEIPLSGLSVEAIAAVLDRLPPTNPQLPTTRYQLLASAIHQATSGNAFFVLETIRSLLESQELDEPPADLPLPPTVQEAIRGRLERLDPLSHQILEAAAIVAPEINFQLLGPVTGRAEDEIVDGLETLTSRQLLTGSSDHLQFQHELARVVVYEDLSHWRRRLLHRRAAEALSQRHRGRSEQVAARIAGHYEAASEIELACSFYRDAAAVARSQYAYRQANHHLQRIIDLQSRDPVDPEITGRLYETLADNWRAMARFDAAENDYRRALEITPEKGSLWRADVLRKLAAVIKPSLRFQEADELYSAALRMIAGAPRDPQVDKPRYWLQLQLDRLDLYYGQARLDDMVELLAEVEPVAQDVDEPLFWSQYYAALTRMRAYQERFAFSPETEQMGRERLVRAVASDNPREMVEQQFGLGFVLLWAGKVDEAAEMLRGALAKSEEVGHIFIQIQCLTYLSIAHRFRGDTDLAGRYLRLSQEITGVNKHRYYVGVDHATQAWLLYKEADWDRAVAQARAALAQWQNTIYPFAWLANWIVLAHGLEKDKLDEACEAAADMLRPDQQRLPDDLTAALETAKASANEGTARADLATALRLAEEHGYL